MYICTSLLVPSIGVESNREFGAGIISKSAQKHIKKHVLFSQRKCYEMFVNLNRQNYLTLQLRNKIICCLKIPARARAYICCGSTLVLFHGTKQHNRDRVRFPMTNFITSLKIVTNNSLDYSSLGLWILGLPLCHKLCRFFTITSCLVPLIANSLLISYIYVKAGKLAHLTSR